MFNLCCPELLSSNEFILCRPGLDTEVDNDSDNILSDDLERNGCAMLVMPELSSGTIFYT